MLELLIELNVDKHVISRRILVSKEIELNQLHNIIQIVLGWKGYHMHQYVKSKDNTDYTVYFDSDQPFYSR